MFARQRQNSLICDELLNPLIREHCRRKVTETLEKEGESTTEKMSCEEWLKKCAREGERMCGPCGCRECCLGLSRVQFREPVRDESSQIVCRETGMTVHYCIKCGDGICKEPENWCICSEDCQKPEDK
jgi:hypothetical protein